MLSNFAEQYSRRLFLTGVTSAAISQIAGAAHGQATPKAPTEDEIDLALRALLTRNPWIAQSAEPPISAYQDLDLASSLIFALRYSVTSGAFIEAQLARLTGETDRAGWFDWMLWQEAYLSANPEVRAHPSYRNFKRDYFLIVDPNFADFLKDPYLDQDRMRIRFEEIAWGGVIKDGIPSLDNPAQIPARAAAYLLDDDLVFGVSINGDSRAYPLRIMGWHEMFNDVIGGVPVALAYCTLCGSGILFETAVEGRAEPFVFGSSGFLYRSNKLMFDRETESLWNQFTGRPVVGPLVDSDVELRQRPVVIAPWRAWLDENPATTVLSLSTGHFRDYGSGVVYRDYFASDELMFPAVVDQTQLAQKDYVFGVRTFAAAKAWPLAVFAGGRVINDNVGALNLVLIGDADGRTVRAYDRGGLTFERDAEGTLSVGDDAWRMTEEALIGPNGAQAPRVAGHIAYWFAWNGYLGAEAALYQD